MSTPTSTIRPISKSTIPSSVFLETKMNSIFPKLKIQREGTLIKKSHLTPLHVFLNKETIITEEINPIVKISQTMAVTDSELACFHTVRHILRSHRQLTEEDIQYAANYISSIYAYNYDHMQYDSNLITKQKLAMLSKVRENSNIFNDDQLIRVLTYADQKGICKFALLFNEELDIAIRTKNTILFDKLLIGPKEMFIELYDNRFLSYDNKEFIIRLISREMFSMTLFFKLIKDKILDLETIDYKCTIETLELALSYYIEDDAISSGVQNITPGFHMTTLATKCYDEICIQDSKILDDDYVRGIMSKYERPSELVYTIDKPVTSSSPHIYCFDTLTLIDAVTENFPINPQSNEPFSNYALEIIHNRFQKEIDMYRRYKEIKLSKPSRINYF
jgi:hypothetical protein